LKAKKLSQATVINSKAKDFNTASVSRNASSSSALLA
jgi:hypothetical protein